MSDSARRSDAAGARPAVAPPVVMAMVAHAPGEWFETVLGSIARQDYPNLQLLVLVAQVPDRPDVSANVAQRVRAVVPSAVVRQVAGNPGFGPVANEVLRLVDGASGWFLFCHDDVALERSTVSLLVDEAERSGAGVASPKVVDWDDPTILQHVGFDVDRFGEVDPLIEPREKDQGQHDAVRDCFAVSSACMLVRADLFRDLGGFVAEIDYQGEDVDLCWRAHLLGARVLLAPAARARHRGRLAERNPAAAGAVAAARNRVRTVAVLTGRWRVPVVFVQMAAFSAASVVVGALTGRVRDAVAGLRATFGVVFDAPYILSRRLDVRHQRAVRPDEVAKLMLRGSARISSFVRRRRTRASSDDGSFADRGHGRAVLGGIAAAAALVLVGSRNWIFGGVSAVGDFLPITAGAESPGALFASYVSGWWPAGFGQQSANPTGLALLAVGGLASFGNFGALTTWSVLAALFLGWGGAWALGNRAFGPRARLAGTLLYAALPVPYQAFAEGRWSVLVVYATVPWFARCFVVAGRGPVGARLTQSFAAAILATSCAAAFNPTAAVLMGAMALTWGAADAVAGVPVRSVLRVARLAAVALLGAIVLNVPWSLTFFGDNWALRTFGAPDETSTATGLWSVVQIGGASMTLGALAALALLPLALSLFVARAERALWAIRGAFLVVPSLAAALAIGRGTAGAVLPDVAYLLPVVGLGAALGAMALVGELVDGVLAGIRRAQRVVAVLAVTVATVAAVPVVLATVDGRWNQPSTTSAQLLAQLPVDPPEGDFHVAYVGARGMLPVSGHPLTGDLHVAVADDGPVSASDYWQPLDNALIDSLDAALVAAIDTSTVRAGRLLAPLAVRYVVVPIAPPGEAAAEPGPELARVLDGLSGQLDMRRVFSSSSLAIFENRAWIPLMSVLDDDSAVLSTRAGADELLTGQIAIRGPIQMLGATSSSPAFVDRWTVHLASPFSERMALNVGGVKVQSRIAFGGTTAFDSPVSGVARLEFRTEGSHRALVALQAFVWVAALVAAADLGRYRRRSLSLRPAPVVLVEGDDDGRRIVLDGGAQ